MTKWISLLFLICGCAPDRDRSPVAAAAIGQAPRMARILIAADGHGFITAPSNQTFRPWGMNYGNSGRLLEDFWNTDWKTLADDFREMKTLGANVVRIHLQFGKFMDAPATPNALAFRQLERLLRLAEQTGLYLDVTGLGSYRPADVPKWYDALDERARRGAQANFWENIAALCASSPAIFCYDLMNEPLSPGNTRQPGKWRSGSSLGGYDFLQFIALDPGRRAREEIPIEWIRRMSTAIRLHDHQALITVGLLPWSREWKHLSGFVPEKVASELSFMSVHIYPDRKKPDEALESLRHFAVGKPLVIEETFPLSCDIAQLEDFMRASREFACGWIGHYDGATLTELDARERDGKLTVGQAFYRDWLRLFVRVKPEFAP